MIYRSDLVKVGKYISKLRKRKGYTQKTLGELLDVSDKTISKWEQGSIAPDITILKQLASVLDSDVDELLEGEEKDSNKVINTQINNKSNGKYLIAFIIGFVLGAMILFFVQRFYRVDYKTISVSEELTIDGFIVSTNSKYEVVINNILCNYNELGTMEDIYVKDAEIMIESDDDILFEKKYSYEEKVSIRDYLSSVNIIVEIDKKYSKKDIYIEIKIYDNITEGYTYKYKL